MNLHTTARRTMKSRSSEVAVTVEKDSLRFQRGWRIRRLNPDRTDAIVETAPRVARKNKSVLVLNAAADHRLCVCRIGEKDVRATRTNTTVRKAGSILRVEETARM